MKKAIILTYGCQMNVNESEKAKTLLLELGYEFCEKISEADLVMLNTCTIREGVATKIYGKLGELKTIKNKGKHQIVIVSGCLAQEDGEILLKKWKHVNIVVGNQNIYLLKDAIHKIENLGFKQLQLTGDIDLLPPMIFPEHDAPTSAFVSITYGCNNFCAYCIVPYVRGRERSEPMENVIEQIKVLVSKGVKEIVLLGQNVNSYGKGMEDVDFARLLRKIKSDVQGKFRMRFASPHPRDFTLDAIRAMSEDDRVSKNIHLPLQAGSDHILKLMNRGYTQKEYLDLVSKIKEIIPAVSFTTDIIVGFPGESEEDFEETLNVARAVNYENAYMFAYSVRKGTKAEMMEGHLEESVKSDRLKRLMEIQTKISLEQSLTYTGSVQEILIEGYSEKSRDYLQGRTDSNKVVLVRAEEELAPGDFIDVKVIEAKTWTLYGERVSGK